LPQFARKKRFTEKLPSNGAVFCIDGVQPVHGTNLIFVER